MIDVGIAYATRESQIWRNLSVNDGATIRDVISKSGILDEFPEIDLGVQKVGIFGEIKPLDAAVKSGDRVEIYRPILIDPQELEHKRYKLRDIHPIIVRR